MVSEISAVDSRNTAPEESKPAAGGLDRLANKDVFLQLLVAQVRNQDPLNPSDGTEFLAQLAQFSELEQMLQMRSELEAIRGALEGAAGNPAEPEEPPADAGAQANQGKEF